MAVYKGELIVAGVFSQAGSLPVNNIARWNGVKWDSLGSGVNGGAIGVLVVDTINNLLFAAGGYDTAGGQAAYGLAMWDGNSWTPISGAPLPGGLALCIYHNKLYTGGGPATVKYGVDTIRNIAEWKGGKSWDPMGKGADQAVTSLCVFQDNMYVGGNFQNIGSNAIKWLAKYNAPTGINEIEKGNSLIKIYPNPTHSVLNIELAGELSNKEKLRLCLFDAIGKEVICQAVLNSQTQAINISQLSKGVYLVNLVDEHNAVIASQKVVLE